MDTTRRHHLVQKKEHSRHGPSDDLCIKHWDGVRIFNMKIRWKDSCWINRKLVNWDGFLVKKSMFLNQKYTAMVDGAVDTGLKVQGFSLIWCFLRKPLALHSETLLSAGVKNWKTTIINLSCSLWFDIFLGQFRTQFQYTPELEDHVTCPFFLQKSYCCNVIWLQDLDFGIRANLPKGVQICALVLLP